MTPLASAQSIQMRFFDWEFQISAHDKKVAAVALASLALFALQLGFSWGVALSLTMVITVLTYISPNENDWFNFQFDHKTIVFICAFLILKPIIIQVIYWALGLSLPQIAQEGVAKLILSEPWKWVPMATLVAPFTEEILFRGFLLEKMDDLGLPQTITDIGQSLIFGAVHLNKQIEEGMKIPVFLGLSAMGYAFTWFKRDQETIIAPMLVHSANNIGACGYVFLAS